MSATHGPSAAAEDRHPMTGNAMSGAAAGGLERHAYDVVVIGAGGAGLRAAIAAHEAGARTAVVCKSLLGKAHTVMAEGGIAAALGNRWPEDNWQVHFRDTMRGGKMLNNWRMAQLHAQEAPERVQELEDWGALFDRTDDGLISQRDFGGHRYARLAHVGDRTGLEMIRTLQQRVVALGIDVFMECTVTELCLDGGTGDGGTGAISGAFGYWRETGRFVLFEAPAVVLATGGIGKSFKVTSNSWEYTGDGHALALRAGASLINMEFVQFHPTGMVWPPSVKGLLVTESVRGDGGVLRNSEGKRFMFDYIPDYFRAETADTEEEADRWYDDKAGNRRPPELLPRDEVARAINSEIKAGRGSPHGGVFLDIASRRSAEFVRRRLPSMYHQFKELADVDITAEPMEIGPTCHYVMGGIEVDPDTQESSVEGLYAVGECSGGMHGSNRLGGNSLSDLLVFGRLAGEAAAKRVVAGSLGRTVDAAQVAAAQRTALAPFEGGPDGVAAGGTAGTENPYTVQQELQQCMNDLVGIIRTGAELREALERIEALKVRAEHLLVEGHRQYNPGWHLALDLRNMLLVSEAVARAALAREESRGGHTRDDFPGPSPEWGAKNLVVTLTGTGTVTGTDPGVGLHEKPLPVMPDELSVLFDDAAKE
ncbi:MAG: Succinate dehydrogenase flavoprotein subunit [uncultured Pseudonocardia sp.]|uniref:Succinate dehydrogenase flavoprotein subunit n=1 Tax=uncultured Pseudonocardia sp. TaxID=211455 RepID=A0A6J4PER5_9PSEU|nr:MAG: Succinate dehydrogenase flavoprotein subunit [uncultured Pseudonocardia sp.]